ncbi:MAG TPA: amino acid permease, partial [Ktedonobacterales bacterium]|nr:amino acid permease [Ktedonobacterales bacterium]
MSTEATSKEELIKRDIKRLHGLGYAQELYRAMGGFSNFAISFTIISILSGALTLFATGMSSAGPVAGSIGWPLVAIFVTIVGLAMAELASAFPTAGGLYYWSSKLGGPAWGWYTGWFNLLGQFAITAGIDYGLAFFIDFWLSLKITSFVPNARTILVTYAIVLVIHALMNTFGIKLVALLNDVSVWWHIGGVLVIVGALLLFAPHNPDGLAFTFKTGYTQSGFPFWYAFLLGLLLAQYTFTGYDASAHVSEETVGADTRAPWGIVMSIVVSAVAGYILLMGLILAIPNLDTVLANGGFNGYGVVPYILKTRLGGDTAFVLIGIAVVAQFFCGMSSVTSNSRMIYAFSRDGAMPFSKTWHTLSKRRIPANAIWLAVAAAFVLAVPSLWNSVAYFAITSISVIGLYIAYVIPVLLRRLNKDFKPGVWNLGKYSALIGWIAVVWVAFISILFMLPSVQPITRDTFNYTPVVVLGSLILLTIWWLVSVRKWFKGPKV